MDNNDRRIILHIGPGKTGTSALQVFFAQNTKWLLSRGFLYPELQSINAARDGLVDSGNAALLARSLLKPELPFRYENETTEMLLESLQARISLPGVRNVLLSSEFFYFVEPDSLRKLRVFVESCGFSCSVLCYLRRQDDLIRSVYTQMVRQGQVSGPLNTKLVLHVRHNFDFAKRLEKLDEVFGAKEVIARIYERGQYEGGDIFHDILAALGIYNTEGCVLPAGRINVAPPSQILAAMAEINGVLQKPMPDFIASIEEAFRVNSQDLEGGLIQRLESSSLMKRIRRLPEETAKKVLEILAKLGSIDASRIDVVKDAATRDEILAYFAEGNRKIAIERFGRMDGRLFYDP